MTLQEFFKENRKVAIAFSGGVDSAYLLYAAAFYGAQVKAYYVKSVFQPDFELEDARRLVEFLNKQAFAEMNMSPAGKEVLSAEMNMSSAGKEVLSAEMNMSPAGKKVLSAEMNMSSAGKEVQPCGIDIRPVEMEVLPVDILSQKTIEDNPADRCYYCKKAIFSTIQQAAFRDGFTVLLDGTNASDDAGDRPGMRAVAELSVLSPLRLCGLTKNEIRRLSKEAGLFTWDKPAYACLATRVPVGTPITREILAATERGEAFLSSLGFRDFRIRYMNGAAKIQLPKDQLPKALACRAQILEALKQDYSSVVLDLETR